MSNHIHLLVTAETPGGVSLLMRDLGREYVQYVNKRHERTGTLWDGRFRSSTIDSDHYCLACYRYIEMNPVRAGIANKPNDYPWSSFGCNAFGKSNDILTPHDCWLLLGKDAPNRCASYRRLFEHDLNPEVVATISTAITKEMATSKK